MNSCEKAEERIKVSQGVGKPAKNQTASRLITVQVQVVYAGHKNDKYAFQVRSIGDLFNHIETNVLGCFSFVCLSRWVFFRMYFNVPLPKPQVV